MHELFHIKDKETRWTFFLITSLGAFVALLMVLQGLQNGSLSGYLQAKNTRKPETSGEEQKVALHLGESISVTCDAKNLLTRRSGRLGIQIWCAGANEPVLPTSVPLPEPTEEPMLEPTPYYPEDYPTPEEMMPLSPQNYQDY